jgi:hypothetical protein
MSGHVHPDGLPPAVQWRKNRRLLREGFKDLVYLPSGGWSMTLSARAYSARRQIAGRGDLNLWAIMHGCPASRRYAELGGGALVLWHGTSAVRADKIRQVGLFPKKGVWATAEPKLAHSFSRNRAGAFSAGSAVIVLVFDRENIAVPFEMANEPDTLRFRSRVGPEHIEYVVYDDRIDFVGQRRAPEPKPWGTARFKKAGGRWIPHSRTPVRFDSQSTYASFEEWLLLATRRVLATLGAAAAIEVCSSLYSTIEPTEALGHEAVLSALDRLCGPPKDRQGLRRFSLKSPAP